MVPSSTLIVLCLGNISQSPKPNTPAISVNLLIISDAVITPSICKNKCNPPDLDL